MHGMFGDDILYHIAALPQRVHMMMADASK